VSREINAIEYLPPFMAELREFKELYNGLQGEFDLMYSEKDEAMEECFALLCKSFGLERYEKLLSLTPQAGESVEDRRMRVLAALNGDTPYTFASIYAKLVLLCGEGNVYMEYAKDIYTLRVMVQLDAKSKFDTVRRMLKRMLPCNISLKCSLAYNTHRGLMPFKHSTLGTYTQRSLREEVIK
jgi:hypothetical protein